MCHHEEVLRIIRGGSTEKMGGEGTEMEVIVAAMAEQYKNGHARRRRRPQQKVGWLGGFQ